MSQTVWTAHLAHCQLPEQSEKNILQCQILVIKCLAWKVTQVTSAYINTLGGTRQKGPGNTTLPRAQEVERQKDTVLIGLSWWLKGLMSRKHWEEYEATCYMLCKVCYCCDYYYHWTKWIQIFWRPITTHPSSFSLLNWIWLKVSWWFDTLFPFSYQWLPVSHQAEPYLSSAQTQDSPQGAPPASPVLRWLLQPSWI